MDQVDLYGSDKKESEISPSFGQHWAETQPNKCRAHFVRKDAVEVDSSVSPTDIEHIDDDGHRRRV